MVPRISLKAGREKALLRRHPWIFSGAIHKIDGAPEAGDLVVISSQSGEVLGYGGFSPLSQIRCRMWNFKQVISTDLETEFAGLLRDRIKQSVETRRADPLLRETNAFRLIHAESDQLPGLIVDQYANVLVVQFLSAGVEKWRDQIIQLLDDICRPSAIFERSDADVRSLEGLEERNGLISGSIPQGGVIIQENGLAMRVEIQTGHKTGFYLDQRENRKLLRDFVTGKDVLDCFSYTGGFTLNALYAGASSLTAVDQSEDALEQLTVNLDLNTFSEERVEIIDQDVFQILRKFRDQGRSWDVIVLDPPKFAPTKSQAQKAARGYKDINLLAAKMLRPGGILFTFSCSGGVDQKLFQQIVAGAAADAEVDLQIIRRMGQGSDHPVWLNFPEGEYLKGFVCRRAG